MKSAIEIQPPKKGQSLFRRTKPVDHSDEVALSMVRDVPLPGDIKAEVRNHIEQLWAGTK